MPNKRIFTEFRRPQSAQVPLGPFTQGVNEKSEPHLLEFSEMSDAANIVIDESTGRTSKRPGTSFKATIPFLLSPPKRAYNFIKRNGSETLYITDDIKVVATNDLINFVDVTPSAALENGQFIGGTATIEFETADDLVWLTNGIDPVCTHSGVLTEAMIAYDKTAGDLTLSGSDTNAQVTNAALHLAGAGTWVGQTVVVTDAADQNVIGRTSVVSIFSNSLDRVTFAPIPGLALGDKVRVGVSIPRGKIIRHHFGTLFMGSTVDNLSEIRFTDTVDPNQPSLPISFTHPLAWPPELQLDSGQGDRLWGFSPIYRDRFAAFKATGIFRVDPDPTFRFVLTAITSQIGSRFPGTWRQHNNILMFLGQDSDGLPDIYMTDFTDISHFNRKHSVTLDSLKQPRSIFKDFSISSKSEFDSGVLSDLVNTNASALQCRVFSNPDDWTPHVLSNSGIDFKSGGIGLLGSVVGGDKYNPTALPENSSPAWSNFYDNTGFTFPNLASGELRVNTSDTFPNTHLINAFWNRQGVLNATKDSYMVIRARQVRFEPVTQAGIHFGLWNGSKCAAVAIEPGSGKILVNSIVVANAPDIGTFHTFCLLLKANGTFKIWTDGALKASGNAASTALNKIQFGAGHWGISGGAGADFNQDPNGLTNNNYFFTLCDFNGDYKGDTSPLALPDTLPTFEFIDFRFNYKKAFETSGAPHSYGKYHFNVENNSQVLSFSTATQGRNQPPGFSFVSFTNGQQPSDLMTKQQYLIFRMIFSTSQIGRSQVVKSFTGGFLAMSQVIPIGSEISAWGFFQRTLLQAFPQISIRIRRSTAASLAADSLLVPSSVDELGWLRDQAGSFGTPTDAEGWINISDAQNIGIVLGGADAPPDPPVPIARHVQILFEAHVDSIAQASLAGLDSALINWSEGAPEILPVMATTLKKRWLLLAASSDSVYNNLVVTVDANRSIVNWKDIFANFLVWFRGKLYAGSAKAKELLQVDDVKRDDNGSDGLGGRLVAPISAFIETRQEIGGEIHSRKKGETIDVLTDNASSGSVVISAKREEQSAFTQVGAAVDFSPSQTHKRVRMPVGYQFKRVAIRIENNTLDADLPIEGIIFSFARTPGKDGK